jgi:hypothetical protein
MEERTLWDVFDEESSTSLPYAGTSGWSGSDTSRERTRDADTSGATSYRQSAVLFALFQAGEDGLTWKEVGDAMGWHHGTSSGCLSVLHMVGRIARLSVKRDRCKVYVHLDYVAGRDIEFHGRRVKPCPNCGYEGDR